MTPFNVKRSLCQDGAEYDTCESGRQPLSLSLLSTVTTTASCLPLCFTSPLSLHDLHNIQFLKNSFLRSQIMRSHGHYLRLCHFGICLDSQIKRTGSFKAEIPLTNYGATTPGWSEKLLKTMKKGKTTISRI